MNNNDKFGIKVFEKHQIFLLLINNGGKITLGFFAFLLLLALASGPSFDYLIRLLHIIIIFSIIIIGMGYAVKRFIHRIKFNFGSATVELYTYRSSQSIKKKIDEVSIKIKMGYLLFYLDDRLFIYNGKLTSDLKEYLNSLNPRQSHR